MHETPQPTPDKFREIIGTENWLLGCPECLFTYGANAAGRPICPDCGSRLRLYDARPQPIRQPRSE